MDQGIVKKLSFLVGSAQTIEDMAGARGWRPYDGATLSFFETLSKTLMRAPEARAYPEVVSLGFWLRPASLRQLRERFGLGEHSAEREGGAQAAGGGVRTYRVGRGVSFHIAPSNVPVNFAYSMAAALLMGNACIVRVPSKAFAQVEIICGAIRAALLEHAALRPRIALLRYGRDREVNDALSALADVRIIWGGDATIDELRKSPLPPRAVEVCFADRYSLAVIESGAYLAAEDKRRIALDFYNDTYLSDQNACTSPRLIAWVGDADAGSAGSTVAGSAGSADAGSADSTVAGSAGSMDAGSSGFADVGSADSAGAGSVGSADGSPAEEAGSGGFAASIRQRAKETFWRELHQVVREKYAYQDIQGVNKLDRAYLAGTRMEGLRMEPAEDNLITRVHVEALQPELKQLWENSGFFYEYDCDDVRELAPICDDSKCQTLSYYGDRDRLTPLLDMRLRGIDRVVPLGQTMDFDLLWDGYDLGSQLTRTVAAL